jgi:hypothetical protein
MAHISRRLKIIIVLFLSTLIAWYLYEHYFTTPPKTALITTDSNTTYRLKQIFPIPLRVERLSTPINATQIDLSFDPTYLQVVAITTGGSYATIFIDKLIDNQAGRITLAGGLPNPGYSESSGHFGTIYFEAIQAGSTELTYLHSSLIIANNAATSNVIDSLPNIPLTILPESLSSSDLIQQQTWYKSQIQQESDPSQLIFEQTPSN